LRPIAAAVASALLYALLFPPFGLAFLSWLALVPLFLALRGASARAAGLAGGVFGLVTTALIVAWLVPTLHGHFERPLARSVLFLVGLSLVAMAPYTSAALAAGARGSRRMPAPLRPWMLAAAWVGSELARTHLGVASPWTKLGDAHFDSERLRQLASLFGVYGVSGLVALGNAIVAEALATAHGRLRGRSGPGVPGLAPSAVVFALLLVAALVYGQARLAAPPPGAAGLDVAVVQGNDSPELRWTRAGAAQALRRYARLTRTAFAGDARPDLLVWPENAMQVSLDDPVYGPPLRRIAAPVPVLLGAPRVEERDGTLHHFNSAFLLDGDAPLQHYDKRRLLPFSETQPLGAFGRLTRQGELDAEEYTPGDRPGPDLHGGTVPGARPRAAPERSGRAPQPLERRLVPRAGRRRAAPGAGRVPGGRVGPARGACHHDGHLGRDRARRPHPRAPR
jgi:apolipoprotein N-acyltransferase